MLRASSLGGGKILRGIKLGVVWLSVAALLLAGCGGGDSEVDPVALVVQLLESEPPSKLPKDIEVDGPVDFYTGYGARVADLAMYFLGPELELGADLYVFRTEDEAIADFEDIAEFYEDLEPIEVKGNEALRCFWDGDFVEVTCIVHQGTVSLEVYAYGVGDEDPERDDLEPVTIELSKTIVSHVKSLEKKATKKVASVPVRPLAAMLGAVVPPPAPDGNPMDKPDEITTDTALISQFDDAFEMSWIAGDNWRAFFAVLKDDRDAQSFRDRYFGTATVINVRDKDASCARGGDNQYWICVSMFENVVVLAEHFNPATALDSAAADYAARLVEHVRTLKGGALPPPPETSSAPPAATRAPTRVPATPTPVPTPTRIPGPNAINSGTWTFEVTVRSNDCGGTPAPGENVTLRYVFSEGGSDQMIGNGEFFSIQQTLPGPRSFGVFTMTLPTLNLQLPVTAGSFRGTGNLTLDFYDVDWADATYVEDYGTCKITADTK